MAGSVTRASAGQPAALLGALAGLLGVGSLAHSAPAQPPAKTRAQDSDIAVEIVGFDADATAPSSIYAVVDGNLVNLPGQTSLPYVRVSIRNTTTHVVVLPYESDPFAANNLCLEITRVDGATQARPIEVYYEGSHIVGMGASGQIALFPRQPLVINLPLAIDAHCGPTCSGAYFGFPLSFRPWDLVDHTVTMRAIYGAAFDSVDSSQPSWTGLATSDFRDFHIRPYCSTLPVAE